MELSAVYLLLLCVVQALRISEAQDIDASCDNEGAVRLVGGRNDLEGTVEVCLTYDTEEGERKREWGTVCDDNWDYRDAEVVCRQLGYPSQYSAALRANNIFEPVSGGSKFKIHLDEVDCAGTEERLLDCPYNPYNDCSHPEDAGVVCQAPTCSDGDVRLTAGPIWKEGRVEVCQNNVWWSLCNEGFDDNAATAVCKQLNIGFYPNPLALVIYYGQSTAPELQVSINCTGGEKRLEHCFASTDYNITATINTTAPVCKHAGVQCDPACLSVDLTECGPYPGTITGVHPFEHCFCNHACVVLGDCCMDILQLKNCSFSDLDGCSEGDLRLVNGTDVWNGRIEMCLSGTWGNICSKYFTKIDAEIVCRQLGLQEKGAIPLPRNSFAGEAELTWLSGIECEGHESQLVECRNFGPGFHAGACEGDDVGIRCGQPPECEEGRIRLMGGVTNESGRVEVCENGVWGVVCSDGWDDQDSEVVCRELGLTSQCAVAINEVDYDQGLFGNTQAPFVLGNVECSGNEASLWNCKHNSLEGLGCSRGMEAGLYCKNGTTQQCDPESPTVMNVNTRFGTCENILSGIPEQCSDVFTSSGISKVFVSRRRTNTTTKISMLLNTTDGRCNNLLTRYLCYSVFLPCTDSGNGMYSPNSVCKEECEIVRDECEDLWNMILDDPELSIMDFASCEKVGEVLEPLEYCCVDAGIMREVTSKAGAIAGAVSGSIIGVLAISIVVLMVLCYHTLTKRKIRRLRMEALSLRSADTSVTSLLGTRGNTYRHRGSIKEADQEQNGCCVQDTDSLELEQIFSGGAARYAQSNASRLLPPAPPSPRTSDYSRRLTSQILIPSTQIRLLDSVGQGEFGIVYKAHLLKLPSQAMRTNVEPTEVAVKTMKGCFDQTGIREILEESLKMKDFDHPNILNLIGVCIDAGPAPYIIMPFVRNGSLLSFLRKERSKLVFMEPNVDEDQIVEVQKRLLNISSQVAQGMEYLAEKKLVHRDLATRNCMIDSQFIIKVSDFGLSEDLYAKNYFRQEKDASVKLPIKWMAPESINDGIFSEKSDVWSFGITCWEIFSGGKTPYPGLDPTSVIRLLETGGRLDRPLNVACTNSVYELMLQCWKHNPEERPTFTQTVRAINDILNPLAGYMEMGAIAALMGLSSTDTDAFKEEENEKAKAELLNGVVPSSSRNSLAIDKLKMGVVTEAGITILLDPSTPESEEATDGFPTFESDNEETTDGPERECEPKFSADPRSNSKERVQIKTEKQMKLLPLFPCTSIMPDALHTESHMKFIEPVEIICCDSSGGIYHNPLHGITVRIPEEAIPHGEHLEISIGVCLYGNCIFNSSLSPVSAIVWLCSKTETVFLKPIEVIIPHFMECSSEVDTENLKMQFMKAGHRNLAGEAVQFLPADGEVDFTSVPNKGILYTQHFCYLCICAGILPEQLKRRRFCIICAMPQSITTGSIAYFYASYFLDTCIQSVEAQLSKERYFFRKPRVFTFSDMSHSRTTITGEYQCLAAEKPVTLTLQPTKISHDMIDFWQLHQNEELTLMEKMKMYPPSMELMFGDLTSCEEQVVTVLFKGTQEPMEEMKIIVPSSEGTPSNTQNSPVVCKTMPMPALRDMPTMRQLFQLKTVPKESSVHIIETLAPRWVDLALTIDFDPQGRHVQLIEKKCGIEGPVACCRRVLMDWLGGKGTYQPPTWENLLEILEDMKDNLATILHKLLSQT